MVARCIFLGSDRPDLQYAAKAALMSTASPHEKGLVVRLAKYLNGEHRRLVHQSPFYKVIHELSDLGLRAATYSCTLVALCFCP